MTASFTVVRRRASGSSRGAPRTRRPCPACRSRTGARRPSTNACWIGRQRLGRAEPLDRRDLPPVGVVDEREAGVHGEAVEQDRAGAAGAAVAADLRARQAPRVAQRLRERRARLEDARLHGAVHRDAHGQGRPGSRPRSSWRVLDESAVAPVEAAVTAVVAIPLMRPRRVTPLVPSGGPCRRPSSSSLERPETIQRDRASMSIAPR